MKTEHVFIQEDIKLITRRCYDCGGFWAVEQFRSSQANCPICYGETVDKKNQKINTMQRQINGLRGALKKSNLKEGV